MSSSAGRSALVALALGACAADPEVHLEVTRVTSQRVTVQLCDPENRTTPCKTQELFAATDAIATVKTLDVFVEDATPRLLLQFTLAAPNFCTQVAITFGSAIDARVELPADATGEATIDGCAECIPGICE